MTRTSSFPPRLVSDLAPAVVPNRSDRVVRARQYLEAGFSQTEGFASWTTDSQTFDARKRAPIEYFSTMVVTQLIVDAGEQTVIADSVRNFIHDSCNSRGFVHFFKDHSLLPADIDCTGVGHGLLLSLGTPHRDLSLIVDRMLGNVMTDGVIEVYEQPAGDHSERVDPCALVNALYLVYWAGREAEAKPSLDLVYEFLVTGAFEQGSRYYPSGDIFLYFLSRLLRDFERSHQRFLRPLHEHLVKRFAKPASTLDRAMRVAAADNVGLFDPDDLAELVNSQQEDGSWPPGAFFKYGRSVRYFGSEAVTTAFALRALVAGPKLYERRSWLPPKTA